MIHIILTDDHAVVRKGLKQIIEETPGFLVTGEASSGNELIEKVKAEKYDVVILDISMPGKDGLDTLKELRQIAPELPVLVFTIYPEEQYAIRLLKAGASGYLNKESKPEELITAIERITRGLKYISPNLSNILASNVDSTIPGEAPLHDSLSDREFQVMCMIGSGKTPTQIANELSLSINTISTYRIRILEKMKMRSNAEITHYAIKNQLVE